MKMQWIRLGIVTPIMAAALLGGLSAAASAADGVDTDKAEVVRVTPPPRPSVETVVEPGETREALARHRRGPNEQKLRGLLRAQQVAPQNTPVDGGQK